MHRGSRSGKLIPGHELAYTVNRAVQLVARLVKVRGESRVYGSGPVETPILSKLLLGSKIQLLAQVVH